MTSDDPVDLYAVLGIERDSGIAEIRAAYRKAAMNKHPDQGGTAEEFAEIKRAYDVLSSASGRKIYDETGKIDELVSSRPKRVVAIITAVLNEIVVSMAQSGTIVKKQDMTQAVVTALDKRRNNVIAAIGRAGKIQETLIQMRGRFKRKEGANVLDNITISQAALNATQMGAIKNELQVIEDAILLVKDHTFETELAIDADYLRRAADRFVFEKTP
jgi:curved DNA-binding protein CbpA